MSEIGIQNKQQWGDSRVEVQLNYTSNWRRRFATFKVLTVVEVEAHRQGEERVLCWCLTIAVCGKAVVMNAATPRPRFQRTASVPADAKVPGLRHFVCRCQSQSLQTTN